jgi:hypothetical protein
MPSIDAEQRRRINPHICLIPSQLGVGFDNFLEFPDTLEERLLPSFLKHIVQSNQHIAEIGIDRVERESYDSQLELLPEHPISRTSRQMQAGYIKDNEGKEYSFKLVKADAVEGKPAGFSGISMHDDSWILSMYDNVMSYSPR